MQSIIRMMIIEDETEVLEGIKASLSLMLPAFCQVYTVGNAEDAMEMIRVLHPHIIITDIVLPRMSGLELLEEVKQIPEYDPKVMVISSFNEFAYAQRSLRLGAMDYVLKPFEKTEFVQKIASIVKLIGDEDHQKFENQHRAEHARMGTKVLMDQYMLSFCTKKTHLQEHIYHRLQLWQMIWLTTSPYRVAAFGLHDESTLSDKDVELQLFSIGNVAGETLQHFQPSYLLKNVYNRWIVISAYPDMDELIDAIRDNVSLYQKLQLICGVSGVMSAFQSLSDGYEQAIQALRWASADRRPALHYGDIADLRSDGEKYDSNSSCLEALINGDKDGIIHAVNDKVDDMVRNTNMLHRKQLAQSSLDWIMEIQSALKGKTRVGMEQIPLAIWENLEKDLTTSSIKRELVDYFILLSGQISLQLSINNNAVIEQAKTIIATERESDLSLQFVAEKLRIHPVWLSHIFKKVTGQAFSDHIIEIKMNKAKSLLRESSLKIYEIAEEISYQDLQHFGKVFKKRTGMSPKEFRYGK
ncbi:response regulator [Paenibacillus sp. WQ 127069]|uniref:Response regulator n=1 Tax=Paenibacillus baimaensis TaxID=2982185 RepID=A0ABT2UDA3_9BACL|nr:response regulator [Paenibacillus sp. WQ 127069]MCU6792580.1 response regulator [Paenibacillus sp. WQ 127069]